MKPFETFDIDAYTVELHQDDDASSPAEWDNLGTLVAFPSLSRSYSFAERESTGDDDDAYDRGGCALLVRYLRMSQGVYALPFQFQDYGSSGARLIALGTDDDANADGFICTTHKRVTELAGSDAQYHTDEWIYNALRVELENWDNYVQGNVAGYVVKDETGDVVDSVWGFYPDAEADEWKNLREEATAAARILASDERTERERAAALNIATVRTSKA